MVNVSSPNTPGLRNLQGKVFLKKLMTAVSAERDALPGYVFYFISQIRHTLFATQH